MKNKIAIFLIALLVMAVIPVYAQYALEEELEPDPESIYKTRRIDGGRGIEITGYVGHGWDLIIPSILNGLPVTSIGAGAFHNHTSITHVIIPNTVTSIGMGAFMDCYDILDVIMPDSVTTIGDEAFSGCSKLSIVTLPSSITKIGRFAFNDCTDLVKVIFQGTIASSGFNNNPLFPSFPGNLRSRFYATDRENGTPGIYSRISHSSKRWSKQR
jgi:hypothetical protein